MYVRNKGIMVGKAYIATIPSTLSLLLYVHLQ